MKLRATHPDCCINAHWLAHPRVINSQAGDAMFFYYVVEVVHWREGQVGHSSASASSPRLNDSPITFKLDAFKVRVRDYE